MEGQKKKRRSWEETSLSECLKEIEDEMVKTLGCEPVVLQWDYIAGDEMKDHVSLESIDETSMTVKCAHPVFASYFKLHQNEVLTRLRTKFPSYNIRKVRIIV